MPWFRASSVLFALWAVVFILFPDFTNELAGIGYVTSGHAEDWTRIVGLAALAFAVLLIEAHRTTNRDLRRIVARGVLAFTLPCAILMTYWQIIPDGRWFRLDLVNVALLYVISYGMYSQGGFRPATPHGGA